MTNVLDSSKTVKGSYTEQGVYNNGTTLVKVNDSYPSTAETRTIRRSGGNTPGYWKKATPLKPTTMSFFSSISLGEAGYDATKSTVLKPNQYNYKDLVQSGTFGGSPVGGHALVSASEVENMKARASNGVLSQIKNQSFNGVQAVAESGQTARLIGHTTLRLVNAYRSLRRGDITSAARHLGVNSPKRATSRYRKMYPVDPAKAASRAWLELQYGWKPLLSDVYGLAEQLAKANNRPPLYRASRRITRVEPIFIYSKSKSGNYISETSRIGEAKAIVHTVVYYRINSPTQATAKEIGLTNPALIAWELLPFSFVADWFIPLGSYIGNFDATGGCVFDSGYTSVFQSAKSQAQRYGSGVDSYGDMRSMLKYSSIEDIRYDRTALAGFPSNTFPSFKNPLSFTHAANAIALLTQLFRK